MFLSIIIPVYNTAKYLAECLESCLDQDIASDDFEIICINDGSTDGSLSVLQSYSQQNRCIRIISQQNAGVSTARNAGIDAARGDYIWFVDSDDIIARNCLRELKEICRRTTCDRLGFYLIAVPPTIPSQEQLRESINSDAVEKQTYEYGYIVPNLMRREFLISHNMRFVPEISYGEDMVFNYTWDLYSYNFEKYDKVLYFYRTNPESVTQVLNDSEKAQIKRIRSVMHTCLWLRKNGMEYHGEGTFRPELALRYMHRLHMMIWGLLPDISHKAAVELWKEIKQYDLLAPECLFYKNDDEQVIIKPSECCHIYHRYAINRLKFCLKHPIKCFLGAEVILK